MIGPPLSIWTVGTRGVLIVHNSVPSILAARNTATVARASQARSMPSVGNQAPGRGLRLGTVAEIDAAPSYFLALRELGRI